MIARQYEFLLAGRRTVVILNGHVDRSLSTKGSNETLFPCQDGFLVPRRGVSFIPDKERSSSPDRTCLLSSDRKDLVLLIRQVPCAPVLSLVFSDRTSPVSGLSTGRISGPLTG